MDTMRARGPKCKLCNMGIQVISYDSGYLKVVKPGEPKASFVCWECAEKLLGEKMKQITGP